MGTVSQDDGQVVKDNDTEAVAPSEPKETKEDNANTTKEPEKQTSLTKNNKQPLEDQPIKKEEGKKERENREGKDEPGSKTSGCSGVKVRKDVSKLESQEKKSLEAALSKMVENGKFHELANYHKGPGPAKCIHGKVEFLAWHRLYGAEFEEALGLPLPYWDFAVDPVIPDLWSKISIRLPANRPPPEPQWVRDIPECPGDNNLLKRTNLGDTSGSIEKMKDELEEAFFKDDYEIFYNALDNPHTTMHGILGCHMSLEPSSYDPVFWLMHTGVDRQFAYWQQLMSLRGIDIPSKPPDADNIQLFNTTGNHEGSNTFEYKKELCYEYDSVLFDGKTAKEFHNAQTMKKSMRSSGGKDIFVGVVIPIISPTANHTFKLCKDKNQDECIDGGGIGNFCPLCTYKPSKIDENTHVIREEKVTKLVNKAGWEGAKLIAHLTNATEGASMPEPLVILRSETVHAGGKVTLAPGQKEEDYGNLLRKYKYKVMDKFDEWKPYKLSDNNG